jgi:hypothetical protein
MRIPSRLGAVARSLVLPALLALGGCNQDPGADNGQGDHEPAACPECPVQDYPKSSTTLMRGTVIPNFRFAGFADGTAQSTTMQAISLGDFYNPHEGDPTYVPASVAADDRIFPPASPYGGGTPKPKALVLDIASVWCGPCNEEAKDLLNGLYAKYKPCGGEFLFQLAEGSAPGVVATVQNLTTWVKTYHVAYPSTLDAARQLQPLYGAGFPDGVIIDTHTMLIVDVISGVPDATFWGTYESLLDAQCLASGN